MKKCNKKIKTTIIITVLFIIISFLAWRVIEKVISPKIIQAETPNSLKPDEPFGNIVLESDSKNIEENEYVPEETTSLYSYTNETNTNSATNTTNDYNESKAIKLAKKYWSGSEDDNGATYVVMDKKEDIYSITLYDKVTTYAFLWLEVNVKDETVTEVPEQYIEQK